MVEILTVLIVIGVLGLIAVSAFRDDAVGFQSSFHALKTHVRFAQSYAMKMGNTWGVACDGNEYWLYQTNSTQVRHLPGADAGKVSLGAMKISIAPFDVAFDAFGRPNIVADMSIGVSSTASADTATLIVTRETGFVP